MTKREFWGAARSSRASATTSCTRCTRCRSGSVLAPFIAMLTGFVDRLCLLHRGAVAAGRDRHARSGRSTCSCSNKWYFDELYDCIFVKPAFAHRPRCSGRAAMARSSTARSTARRRASGSVTDRVVKLQTGYVYHYAFAMLIGVAALLTWLHLRRTAVLDDEQYPFHHHLPAARRARCSSRSSIARPRQRPLDRALDDADHVRRLAAASGVNFDKTNAGLPVRRGLRLARHA